MNANETLTERPARQVGVLYGEVFCGWCKNGRIHPSHREWKVCLEPAESQETFSDWLLMEVTASQLQSLVYGQLEPLSRMRVRLGRGVGCAKLSCQLGSHCPLSDGLLLQV